jgi:hypothetical protein
MEVDTKVKLTFECLDRFNEKHELVKAIVSNDGNDKSYKDILESISIFQTDVNTLMTSLVDREKAEIKSIKKPDCEIDDDNESSVENEDSLTKSDEETDKKKQKTN